LRGISYRRAALLFIALAFSRGGPAAQADEQPTTLTAQEVAVRVEQAGKDPVRLLEVAALAGAKEARMLRLQVKKLLAERNRPAPPEESEQFARRLLMVLPQAARTPAEVQEVLGTPKQTARQILYRRYLEQWHYDAPLPLCVVFECRRGQEPRLQSVLPAPAWKP
jgi:hypothetical protein